MSLSGDPSFISFEQHYYQLPLLWVPRSAGKAVIWRTPLSPCAVLWKGAEIHHLLVHCPLVLPSQYGLLGWMVV